MKEIEHDNFLKDIKSDLNKIGSKIDTLNNIMGVLYFTSLIAMIVLYVVIFKNILK